MLYPEIEPFARGMLDVGQGHRVYWEQCGNPQGQPIVFLHGGPGGGCTPRSRRLFDPSHYRVVLFDQRGCGRSTPQACTRDNSTAHLVRDMEQLRELLQIERWLLCGGSWGSTLALAYTRQHRQRVQGLVLRGVFTAQPHELDWLYRAGGASRVFPQAWDAFATALGPVVSPELLPVYASCLDDADGQCQHAAAMAWCRWENAINSLHGDDGVLPDAAQCLAMARISAHIFRNDPWLQRGDFFWPADYLQGVPGLIVQGQFDMVTPPETAWRLHAQWPDSELRMVREAGHASSDPALLQALVAALDDMVLTTRRPVWQ